MLQPIKARLKHLAARAVRPGITPLQRQVEGLDLRVAQLREAFEAGARESEARSAERHADLVARIDRIEAAVERGGGVSRDRDKYREELAYWRWLIATDEGKKALFAPFDEAFGTWQRDRLRELAVFAGAAGDGMAPEQIDPLLNAWCAQRSVVEVGAGPYPACAAAPAWKRAVAVDPLARGYVEEKLVPAAAGHVTYIESTGESVPLPSGFADLVIIENALDHVDDPGAVVRECVRLLAPGGLVWLLVDLSDYKDHMHPHPFTEERIRGLLGAAGLQVVRDRVSDHKSHPNAYGEYRGLLRKPG